MCSDCEAYGLRHGLTRSCCICMLGVFSYLHLCNVYNAKESSSSKLTYGKLQLTLQLNEAALSLLSKV